MSDELRAPMPLWLKRLKNAVHMAYDAQKLRIQSGVRCNEKKWDVDTKCQEPQLDKEHKEQLEEFSARLQDAEDAAKAAVTAKMKTSPVRGIYEDLRRVKGVGPVGAAILVSELDIRRAHYPSSFWKFCGLAPVDREPDDVDEEAGAILELLQKGKITPAQADIFMEAAHDPKRRQGQKPKAGVVQKSGRKGLDYNAWLRAKVLFVVGGGLLKAENERYLGYYKEYRHRRDNQRSLCKQCFGTGVTLKPKKASTARRVDKEAGKETKCWNCVANREDQLALAAWERKCVEIAKKNENPPKNWKLRALPTRPQPKFPVPPTPTNAPWGRSALHRHNDALRKMMCMFLADLWTHWRRREGLPIEKTYGEVHLGLPVTRDHDVGNLWGTKDPEEDEVIEKDLLNEGDGEDDPMIE